MSLGPGSVSACVVVRNEERAIEACLRSLDGVVDEIVLVHSGPCSDATLDIAARFGARVFVASDGGHGEHNTPLAYTHAHGEWLLNVDADERLSPELRAALPSLVRDPEVAGYAFIWPLWDGERPITTRGPYKTVLMRRVRTSMLGLIHQPERIDGPVRRVPLRLEHEPKFPEFSLVQLRRKWWPWARVQARAYMGSLDGVPRFRMPDDVRWSRRRRVVNALSPLMVVPAALHTFVFVLRAEGGNLGVRHGLRYATFQALYRGMVTFEVARLRYGRRRG